MTTTPIPFGDGYVGWLRIGRGPWKPVVSDSVHDQALAALMAHADRVGHQHKDLVVCKAGVDPNHKPRRFARVQGNALDFVNAEVNRT